MKHPPCHSCWPQLWAAKQRARRRSTLLTWRCTRVSFEVYGRAAEHVWWCASVPGWLLLMWTPTARWQTPAFDTQTSISLFRHARLLLVLLFMYVKDVMHAYIPWKSLQHHSPGLSASLWHGYSTGHELACLQLLWRPGRCPCRGQKKPSGTWGNEEQSVWCGCLKNRKMFSVMKESHYNCSFVQRNQSKETVKRKKIRKEDKEGKPKVTKKKGRKQMFREGRTRWDKESKSKKGQKSRIMY